MIKPTIGRVVWYWPTPQDNKPTITGQPHAAMVTGVHTDSCINLAIKDADGDSYSRTSVTLFQGDAEECPAGSCCWMPYQQAQAAKEA